MGCYVSGGIDSCAVLGLAALHHSGPIRSYTLTFESPQYDESPIAREMALRAGDLAAQEAERGLRSLVTILEPALIIAFGGLVAFVAAALLQAVYSLRPGGF